jgi:hypothetical protein
MELHRVQEKCRAIGHVRRSVCQAMRGTQNRPIAIGLPSQLGGCGRLHRLHLKRESTHTQQKMQGKPGHEEPTQHRAIVITGPENLDDTRPPLLTPRATRRQRFIASCLGGPFQQGLFGAWGGGWLGVVKEAA